MRSLRGKLSHWYEFSQVTGLCNLKQLEVFSAKVQMGTPSQFHSGENLGQKNVFLCYGIATALLGNLSGLDVSVARQRSVL